MPAGLYAVINTRLTDIVEWQRDADKASPRGVSYETPGRFLKRLKAILPWTLVSDRLVLHSCLLLTGHPQYFHLGSALGILTVFIM